MLDADSVSALVLESALRISSMTQDSGPVSNWSAMAGLEGELLMRAS
jgi:hypothetical protein